MERPRLVKGGSQGFTLIELLVVIFLIGLISSLALPRFTKSIGTLSLKTSTKEIAATLRLARDRGIHQKKNYTFYLDTASNKYFISEYSYEDSKNQDIRTYKIREGAEVYGFNRGEEIDIRQEGIITVSFYPGGNSSGGTISLTTSDNKSRYDIAVNRLSGAVRIRRDKE